MAGVIKCKLCGKSIIQKHKNHLYCKECYIIKNREWKKKSALKHPKNKFVQSKCWAIWYAKNKNKIKIIPEQKIKSFKNYSKKYPEKVKAHSLCQKIKKKEYCEICGINGKLEKHHPDYNLPLVFITVCKRCHTKIHYGGSYNSTI